MFPKLKIAILAFALMYVSACMVTPTYQQSDQLRSVKFKSGVIITPPQDYCLDEKLVAETEEAGFVLILPCLDAKGDVEVGLVTVTVVLNDPEAGRKENRFSTTGNKKNFQYEQRFGALKHGSANQIKGMRQNGWQLVETDNRYTSMLTLYIPQYATITKEAAQTRLSSLLKSIRYEQDDTISSTAEYDTLMRPRARPLT